MVTFENIVATLLIMAAVK